MSNAMMHALKYRCVVVLAFGASYGCVSESVPANNAPQTNESFDAGGADAAVASDAASEAMSDAGERVPSTASVVKITLVGLPKVIEMRVRATITGPGMLPVETTVANSPLGFSRIVEVPHGANRTFRVNAFDETGVVRWTGRRTGVEIPSSGPVVVTMRRVGTPKRTPPVISFVTASSVRVEPGQAVQMSVGVEASSTDILSYTWSASSTGAIGATAMDANVFSPSASVRNPLWYAPFLLPQPNLPATYVLRVVVTTDAGLSAMAEINVEVVPLSDASEDQPAPTLSATAVEHGYQLSWVLANDVQDATYNVYAAISPANCQRLRALEGRLWPPRFLLQARETQHVAIRKQLPVPVCYAVSVSTPGGGESRLSSVVDIPAALAGAASDDVDSLWQGLRWLVAAERTAGRWGAASDSRTTAEVVYALARAHAVDGTVPGRGSSTLANWERAERAEVLRRGLQSLLEDIPDDNEVLALRLLALHESGQWPTRLWKRFLASGLQFEGHIWGWGAQSRLYPDAMRTALGRQLLSHFPMDENMSDGTRSVLEHPMLQSASGRYGWQVHGAVDDMTVSAFVYAAIDASPAAYEWIQQRQDAQGSYGNLADTVGVLRSGLPLATTSRTTAREDARQFVLSSQGLNGSWEDDVAQTARAVLALLPPHREDGPFADRPTIAGLQGLIGPDSSNKAPLVVEGLTAAERALLDDPGRDSDGDGETDLQAWLKTQQGVAGRSVIAPSPDVQFDDRLAALARNLQYDPVRIYDFVYHAIEFEDYVGARKGATSTYLTRRGNAWDQCTLLIALLRMSGVPARYVLGEVALAKIELDTTFFPGEHVAVEIWASPQRRSGELRVPLSARENAWLPLLPWHKDRVVVQAGIDVAPGTADADIEIPTALDTRASYLAPPTDDDIAFQRHTQKTSVEYFEDALQDYLDTHEPGRSLSEVPFTTEIVHAPVSVLPTTYPSSVVFSTPSPAAAVHMEIPPEHRVRADLRIEAIDSDALGGSRVVLETTLELARISGRRLVLDFYRDTTNKGVASYRPVLLLDGLAFVESQELLGEDARIVVSYRPLGGQWRRRPEIAVGSFVFLSFDSLRASHAAVLASRAALLTVPPDDALSSEPATREAYLGNMAALIANTHAIRAMDAIRRADELFQTAQSFGVSTLQFIMTWTDPANLAAVSNESDDENTTALYSPFKYHPAFGFDTFNGVGAMYKNNYALHGGSELPWSGYPFLRVGSSFVPVWQRIAHDGVSLAEGRVFEDVLGTPGYSTIGALFLARKQGIEVATLTSSSVSDTAGEAAVRARLAALDDELIDQLIDAVAPDGSVVITPVEPVARAHGAADDDGQHTTHGYIVSRQTGVGYRTSWSYKSFNGGDGTGELADAVGPAIYGWNIGDNPSTTPGTLSEALQAISQLFGLQNSPSLETVAALAIAAGDPVNLVTGEFYTEERPDLVIATRGELEFGVRRGYRSQAIYDGPFGFGWTWNHADSIVEEASGTIHYYTAQRQPYRLERLEDGTYRYPPGATFRLVKDGAEFVVTETNGLSARFGADGRLKYKRDRNGNQLEFVYDAQGHLINIVDPADRVLTLDYNAGGKVQTVTDFTGRAVRYEYDGKDLVAFTDLADNTTRYEVLQDTQGRPLNEHNMTKYILPNGDYLEIAYLDNDRVAWHENAYGHRFEFQYSEINKYAETWDEQGRYQKVFFDDAYNVIRWQRPDGSVEHREYDDEHNMLARIDGDGHRTTFEYSDDGRRNLISATNALGETTRFTYEPRFSRIASVTDPRGYVTRHVYDDRGNRIRTVQDLTLDDQLVDWPVIRFTPARVVVNQRVAAKRVTDVSYDAYGNRGDVVKTVRALSGGSLVDIPDITVRDTERTTYEYDSDYVRAVRVVDAAGRLTTYGHDAVGRVTSIEDAAGTVTRFERHALGGQETVSVDGVGQLERTVFDELGRVASRVDARGGETRYVYRPARDVVHYSQPDHIVDPLGYITTFGYDEVGNVIRETDKNGHTVESQYDQHNRVIARTNALGETTRFSYDARGNVTQAVDPLGYKTKTFYDGAGRAIRTEAPEGQTTSRRYDEAGNVVATIDPLGVETRSHYDSDGREIQQIRGANLASPRMRNTIYDGLGRRLFQVDARGVENHVERNAKGEVVVERWVDADGDVVRSVSYRYDVLGRAISQTDGRGTVTETAYDELGRVARVTVPDPNRPHDASARLDRFSEWNRAGDLLRTVDPMGHVTEYKYNMRGERIAQVNPDGGTETFAYDGNGNRVEHTDARGNTTRSYFDAANRLIAVVDPERAMTWFEYDAAGREVLVTRTSEAGLAHTEAAYDGAGRVTQRVDALGYVTTTTRTDDSAAHTREVSIESPSGAVTRQIFDGFGDKVFEEVAGDDFAVTATHYGYAPGGLLTSVTSQNASGVVAWRYEYDALRRRTQAQDTDGTSETTQHDAEGAPVMQVLRDGTVVRRHFDALGRLVEVVVDGRVEQTFRYDAASRLVRAEDRNQGRRTHVTIFELDELGRRTYETQDDRVVGRAYDWAGNVTELVYPGGNRLQAEYDHRNLPLRYRFAGRGNAKRMYPYTLTYNATRKLTAFGLGEHIRGTATFDVRGFETSRRVERSGPHAERLYDSDLEWDAVGLVHQHVTTATTESVRYGHDALGRTTSYDSYGAAGDDGQVEETWRYDALGNWTSVTRGGDASDIEVNGDNEYVSFAGHAVEHDARGNVVRTDDQFFHYDWNNRLIQVHNVAHKAIAPTYTYDALGRQITKQVGGHETTYVYDGHNIIEERARDGGLTSYAYGPSIDHVAVMEDAAHRAYYYVRDYRNSVVALASPEGFVVERVRYSPFGAMIGQSALSAYGNTRGFTGQHWDAASGLWQYRQRVYSAQLGRFLQRDPIGTADGLNVYAYVGNRPLRFTDPLGLSARALGDLVPNAYGEIEVNYGDDTESLSDAGGIFRYYEGDNVAEQIGGALLQDPGRYLFDYGLTLATSKHSGPLTGIVSSRVSPPPLHVELSRSAEDWGRSVQGLPTRAELVALVTTTENASGDEHQLRQVTSDLVADGGVVLRGALGFHIINPAGDEELSSRLALNPVTADWTVYPYSHASVEHLEALSIASQGPEGQPYNDEVRSLLTQREFAVLIQGGE